MPLDGRTENFLPRTAMKAEMLDAETELKLAYAWRDDRCEESLHRLINAYMRLAISQAAKFKRYGAPMGDLIQEAGLGLMKAAEKFDPDRGVRFSTYDLILTEGAVFDLRGVVDQSVSARICDAQLVYGPHRLYQPAKISILQYAAHPSAD